MRAGLKNIYLALEHVTRIRHLTCGIISDFSIAHLEFDIMTTQTSTITQTGTTPPSFFEAAPFIPPDAIFALTAEYNADTFPQKVNLGQGTYRDENGQPWVLPSVRKSREMLVGQGLNHEYLPILGLQEFRQEASKMALGSGLYERIQSRVGPSHRNSHILLTYHTL